MTQGHVTLNKAITSGYTEENYPICQQGRSGLVVSASDSGPDESGFESRRGTRKLLRSIPGQDVHSHCVSGPPSLASAQLGSGPCAYE